MRNIALSISERAIEIQIQFNFQFRSAGAHRIGMGITVAGIIANDDMAFVLEYALKLNGEAQNLLSFTAEANTN